MPLKKFGRVATLGVALATLGTMVKADEIVHFTNGAEMAVRSHVVDKEMLKLDLGGNSFISFPISMVDKIVNAGQDVFRNPVYYPTNQALAAGPGGGMSGAVTASVGGGVPVGFARQPSPGRNGARLGEATDGNMPADNTGSGATTSRSNPHDDMTTAQPAQYDPLRPVSAGGVATIEPPTSMLQARRPAPMMSPRPQEPPPTPTPPSNNQAAPQPTAPTPPPAESGMGSGDDPGSDSGSQDSPPAP